VAPAAVTGTSLPRGSSRVTVVPSPGSLLITSAPPDCVANPLTMLNPSPVPMPCGLVVKNGSVTRARTSGAMPAPPSVTVMTT
jgi:hypothetical protein